MGAQNLVVISRPSRHVSMRRHEPWWLLILVSAAAVQSPFSIHVPLYNPHLSPSSNETRALIATASSSPNAPDISVAICSTWDFQAPSDVCDTTENNAAADLLRQAGITVLHYIPLQRVPVPQHRPPICCNSMENITRFVTSALSQPNAGSDGIYFDLATQDLSVPSQQVFFREAYDMVQRALGGTAAGRPVMINPSVPKFLEAILSLEHIRINAFEDSLETLRKERADNHSFSWLRLDRGHFAGVVENASSLDEMQEAVLRLRQLGYGAMFVEPDIQNYWTLPVYWSQLVASVASQNAKLAARGRFFDWATVKDHVLQVLGGVSTPVGCSEACNADLSCTAWEFCQPVNLGCGGCYTFGGFVGMPNSGPTTEQKWASLRGE